jgi:hypothetical protein
MRGTMALNTISGADIIPLMLMLMLLLLRAWTSLSIL